MLIRASEDCLGSSYRLPGKEGLIVNAHTEEYPA